MSKRETKQLATIEHLLTLYRLEEAEDLIGRLQRRGVCSKELLLMRIKLLRLSNQLDRSLHLIHWASKRYPEELLFRVEEAFIHLEKKDPHKALQAFVVCEPILHSEREFLAIARAHFLVGNDEKFWDYLTPLLEKNHIPAYMLVGDYYVREHHYESARNSYQIVADNDPAHKEAVHKMGFCYVQLHQLQEAETIFKALLEKDAEDVGAVIGMGSCFEKRGLFYKALHLYQQERIWNKQDPKVFLRAGLCALHVKRFTYAEQYFYEVIAKEGNTAAVLSYIGLALEGQQRWEEAEAIYLRVIQEFPAIIHGYRALAWMAGCGLTQRVSCEEGLEYAYKALSFSQENTIWEILSACYARVGKYQQALKIQEKLVPLDDYADKKKRAVIMRTLRQQLPLDTHLIARHLVA